MFNVTRLQAAAADLAVNYIEHCHYATKRCSDHQLTATGCAIKVRKTKFIVFVLGTMFEFKIKLTNLKYWNLSMKAPF